jgi:glycerol-3-phosphate dehydrogenase
MREENLQKLADQKWDLLVIGGGATGMGVALDGLSRGLSVALIDAHDFAKGTSSRSTKLLHGGVRYLKNGDVSLVKEALHERGLILKNAMHLSREMDFIIPSYSIFHKLFYGVGLKVYDYLSGKESIGGSQWLDKAEVLEHLPTVKSKGLVGGVLYRDGQFDDARMVISMAKTIEHLGGLVLNYVRATDFIKENNKVAGLKVQEVFSGGSYSISAKMVVNATGVFAEKIMALDGDDSGIRIRPSQGVHIVLDKKFLPTKSALMVPSTSDGRVLFAVPWHGSVIVGTTDTEVKSIDDEPLSTKEEVQFILENAAAYLAHPPKWKDIKSVFTGLRPLISQEGKSSKALSRKHLVHRSKSGLVSILGGKWTTYRSMAEETVDVALKNSDLPFSPSKTHHLKLVDSNQKVLKEDDLCVLGAEKNKLPNYGSTLAMCSKSHLSEAFIGYSIENEYALTVEDILARRTRILFLDVEEALGLAPQVAKIMANFMQKDELWEQEQLKSFHLTAKKYQL